MTETEEQLKKFLEHYNLKNLVKELTCYKSHMPRCIDLVLTNRNRSVQETTTIETALSDFHKMVVIVLKTAFPNKDLHLLTSTNSLHQDAFPFPRNFPITSQPAYAWNPVRATHLLSEVAF